MFVFAPRTDDDDDEALEHKIVSAGLAREFYPSREPLGPAMTLGLLGAQAEKKHNFSESAADKFAPDRV